MYGTRAITGNKTARRQLYDNPTENREKRRQKKRKEREERRRRSYTEQYDDIFPQLIVPNLFTIAEFIKLLDSLDDSRRNVRMY